MLYREWVRFSLYKFVYDKIISLYFSLSMAELFLEISLSMVSPKTTNVAQGLASLNIT